jgi:hypothetical protein
VSVSPSATPGTPAGGGPTVRPAAELDNRAMYISFGGAWILGHGASAVSTGPTPLVALPGWLPLTLLVSGLVVGTVFATIGATRSLQGAPAAEALAGRMLGLSWVTGFAGLALAITGLTAAVGMPELQSILWPTGSGVIVGLIYVSEGAFRRNVLHYVLGTWLVLVAGAALLFDVPALFWVLAVAGGGAFAVATVLEYSRTEARGRTAAVAGS